MNKKSLLALLLSCMLILSSCSLIVKDPEVDAATEIIKVGDTVFTKAQVQAAVSNYLQNAKTQYDSQYSQYGATLDITDPSVIEEAQGYVLDGLVRQTVLEKKAAELGADQLSEEEEAELKSDWDSTYEMFKSIFIGDTTDLTEEEVDQQVRGYIYQYYGVTEESMRTSAVQDKLKKMSVADVTVSDEEVQADFDKKVEDAKNTYASNLSAYGSAVNNGTTVYYRPAGYRMVKQILIQYGQEEQDTLSQLNSKITAETNTVNTLTNALSGVENLDELLGQVTVNVGSVQIDRTVGEAAQEAVEETAEAATEAAGEAAEAVTEAAGEAAEAVTEAAGEAAEAAGEAAGEAAEAVTEAAQKVTITVQDLTAEVTDTLSEELPEETRENVRNLAAAKARLAAYQAALTEQTDKAYASIDAEAQEVMDKLAAGEDWDALVAQYNKDPGMSADRATGKTGYAICEGFTSFDSAFVDAAFALENVGDVTQPTRGSSNGYYIIKYVSDVQEGPVDLAEVSEGIHSALLETKQDETFDQMVDQWAKDANAFIDRKSLNN